MPPKEKYSRENIMDAAFELVRSEGLEQLSARNIAKKLGCSTQPIYSSFSSIEELEEQLLERIKEYTMARLLEHKDEESHFLAIGVGYFQFAQTEPMLFRSLFMNGGLKWNFSKDDPFFSPILVKMKRDKWLNRLDNDKLAEMFRDMFIYTHGLATQSNLSSNPVTIETARELIKKMGGVLITVASLSGKFSVEKLMRRFHGWTD